MKLVNFLVLPLVLVAVAGCGSSSKSSSSSSSASGSASTAPSTSSSPAAGPSKKAAAGGTIKVAMRNLAFVPKSVSAKVGETVQWRNFDTAPHNVTYVSGTKFKSSPTFTNGGTFSLKLTKPGMIEYVCTIHPFMKASITVSQ